MRRVPSTSYCRNTRACKKSSQSTKIFHWPLLWNCIPNFSDRKYLINSQSLLRTSTFLNKFKIPKTWLNEFCNFQSCFLRSVTKSVKHNIKAAPIKIMSISNPINNNRPTTKRYLNCTIFPLCIFRSKSFRNWLSFLGTSSSTILKSTATKKSKLVMSQCQRWTPWKRSIRSFYLWK